MKASVQKQVQKVAIRQTGGREMRTQAALSVYTLDLGTTATPLRDDEGRLPCIAGSQWTSEVETATANATTTGTAAPTTAESDGGSGLWTAQR